MFNLCSTLLHQLQDELARTLIGRLISGALDEQFLFNHDKGPEGKVELLFTVLCVIK